MHVQSHLCNGRLGCRMWRVRRCDACSRVAHAAHAAHAAQNAPAMRRASRRIACMHAWALGLCTHSNAPPHSWGCARRPSKHGGRAAAAARPRLHEALLARMRMPCIDCRAYLTCMHACAHARNNEYRQHRRLKGPSHVWPGIASHHPPGPDPSLRARPHRGMAGMGHGRRTGWQGRMRPFQSSPVLQGAAPAAAAARAAVTTHES